MQPASSNEISPRTGRSKVEQYKWLITGQPGKLTFLAKSVLEVDHSYQRIATNARVIKLARRWNWVSCGVLTVAHRAGRYFVIDGQHRLSAALKRADISMLPCLIFESTDPGQEAAGFRDSNKERRVITTFETWNADIVAGDEATIFANNLVVIAGRVPAGVAKATTVRCLSALVAAARTNREELCRVWPLVVQICADQVLHERVFGSLMYLETHLENGISIAKNPWRERVLKLGYQGIVNSAASASAFYARGGTKVWALGVMEQLNKGCRSNRLSISTEDAGKGGAA